MTWKDTRVATDATAEAVTARISRSASGLVVTLREVPREAPIHWRVSPEPTFITIRTTPTSTITTPTTLDRNSSTDRPALSVTVYVR